MQRLPLFHLPFPFEPRNARCFALDGISETFNESKSPGPFGLCWVKVSTNKIANHISSHSQDGVQLSRMFYPLKPNA